MTSLTSNCLQRFGHADFDAERVNRGTITTCPIRNCSAKLVELPYGKQKDREGNPKKRTKLWCPDHGIRLHAGTFVCWNGPELEDDARLRNFIVRQDLVRAIALRRT